MKLSLQLDNQRIFLIVIALLMITSGLGLRDPWNPDEPRFVLIAKQMIESGNWLVPYRGIEIYADKPPLFIWLQAIFYKLIPYPNIAFLLPSLLAACGVLVMTYDMARRLWNSGVAFFSTFALLGTWQFGLQAKMAQIDMVLALFTTIGLYGLVRVFLLGESTRWLYISFLSMGCGIITKGVGFLPLFFLIPLLYGYKHQWNNIVKHDISISQWATAAILFVFPIAAWILPLMIVGIFTSNPELHEYLQTILYHQTFNRYTDSWAHLRPFWYLFGKSFTLWLPTTLLIPFIYTYVRKQLVNKDAVIFSLLVWIILVILFFSLSPGKRGVYILPALPAFALIAGVTLYEIRNKVTLSKMMFYALMLISILFIAIPSICYFSDLSCSGKYLFTLKTYLIFLTLAVYVFTVGIILSLSNYRILQLNVAVIVFWLILGWGMYPEMNQLKSANGIMTSVSKSIGKDGELALVHWREDLMLHVDREVQEFGFMKSVEEQSKQAQDWMQDSRNRWVLAREDAVNCCFEKYQSQYMDEHSGRKWYLIHQIN